MRCPEGRALPSLAQISSGYGSAVEEGFVSLGCSIAIASGAELIYQEREGTCVHQACACPLPSLPAMWVTCSHGWATFELRRADLGPQCSPGFLHMVGVVLRGVFSLCFQTGVMPWPL